MKRCYSIMAAHRRGEQWWRILRADHGERGLDSASSNVIVDV